MLSRLIFVFFLCLIPFYVVWAGPPFVTDDPVPVDLRHWEVYIASQQEYDPSGGGGTLPHIEINYGAISNLQVHLITSYMVNWPSGRKAVSGYGDTELGIKYRFLQESTSRPMAGIFPLVELPTGNSKKGLGSGHYQFFLPVWLQKSWNSWTSFGGGGYFNNPGEGNRNYWLIGWEIQKDLSPHLTLGGEIFGTTPTVDQGEKEVDFNLGGQYNFDEVHHLLFSAGRSFQGEVDFAFYLAFQWTLGPSEAPSHNFSLMK